MFIKKKILLFNKYIKFIYYLYLNKINDKSLFSWIEESIFYLYIIIKNQYQIKKIDDNEISLMTYRSGGQTICGDWLFSEIISKIKIDINITFIFFIIITIIVQY